MNKNNLQRSLNLPLLTLYGLGNILGAGIYVLIGKVAGFSGTSTTLAFMSAMAVASFTAFSYMELASRYPVSASVSVYLHEAFKRRRLSVGIGLALVVSGLASAAALSQGFAGYFRSIVDVPAPLISVALILLVGALALKGIGESAKVAAAITVAEVLGLLIIVWFGRTAIADASLSTVVNIDPAVGLGGVVSGAFLAFYAFIGFEDMVNVSEEVKNPQRTMPIAIVLALIASTVLYILVSVVAIGTVAPSELSESDAPLATVLEHTGSGNPALLSGIAMIAAVNGVIVQVIMGSRILYGLSKQGWIHSVFSKIHEASKTPTVATFTIVGLMILGAVLLPLVSLAQITSLLVLSVFFMVHISLIKIKNSIKAPDGVVQVPIVIPYIGALLCTGLIALQLIS